MSARFTVLGSGSAGNASLLEAGGFGLLLDLGLGPRQLASRMTAADASWKHVHAAILTHTHSDHWNDRTLAHLRRRGIPLYCHADHGAALASYSPEFAGLLADGLIRAYEAGAFELAPGLCCQPLPVRHDGGPTFGFRFERTDEHGGRAWSLGYAADLGSWTADLARSLADVDVLALEFNHDVEMEYASGRSPHLVARVLGDHGHLSNDQAAALVGEVIGLSEPGRLRHVIQLHLSRQCNHVRLAREAGTAVLAGHNHAVEIHTASQDRAGPTLNLGRAPNPQRVRRTRRSRRSVAPSQLWLPGWEV